MRYHDQCDPFRYTVQFSDTRKLLRPTVPRTISDVKESILTLWILPAHPLAQVDTLNSCEPLQFIPHPHCRHQLPQPRPPDVGL